MPASGLTFRSTFFAFCRAFDVLGLLDVLINARAVVHVLAISLLLSLLLFPVFLIMLLLLLLLLLLLPFLCFFMSVLLR